MTKKLIEYKTLNNFILKNPCFEINGNVLFCNFCNETKSYVPREGIRPLKRHINSQKHMKSIKIKAEQTRLNLQIKNSDKSNVFDVELVEALFSTNIPIHKIENKNFRTFLEKYTNKRVNSHTFYRGTIIDAIYDKKFNDVKSILHNMGHYYIIFDETTDSCGRHILSLLIGGCSENTRSKPYLVSLLELEKTTAQNINIEILERFKKYLIMI